MLKINELARLYLGVKNENLSRTINIDMSAWAELYPNATAVILHKRQGDETKELTGAEYDNETMILSWTPTSYDTFYEGFGIAEIRMVEGEVVKKSKDLLVTAVAPSIIDGSGTVIASDYQAWLDSVIGIKQGAVAAKNDAVSAKNDAIAAKQAAEAALNMTDIAGAEAETLAPGSDATAEIVTTQDGKKILFGIPQGERGKTGSGGLNGVTMNGNTMPVDENGIAQLGTVLTAHQSLDGKADIIISSKSSQDVANVKDATGRAVRELVLKVNPIQAGSGDPAPTNPRSISGRSSVVLKQIGVNLLTNKFTTGTSGTVTFTAESGSVKTSGTASSATAWRSDAISVTEGQSYVLSGCPAGGGNSTYRMDVRDTSGNIIDGLSYDAGSGATITIPTGTTQIKIGIRIASGVDTNGLVFIPVLVKSTDAATTHTASIPTTPGTVYGGEIDWVRQKLKVTHAFATFTTIDLFSTSAKLARLATDAKPVGNSDTGDIVASYLKTTYVNNIWAHTDENGIASNPSGYLYARIAGLETSAEYEQYLEDHPLQVVYELATPIEYDLSSLDTITLALGENNLWIDDGQVKLLEYYCDTTLYVNERTDDKAKKPSSATNNNFAALDASGDLKDSGHKHSDYLTSHQSLTHLLPKANVYNGLDKTSGEGYALDARMGYELTVNDSNIRKGLGYQAKLTGGNWQLNAGTDAAAGDYIWVNGQLGRATAAITGGSTNIVENTNWVKVEALNEIGGAVTNLQEGFALIENGDTASQNIAAGTYVLHKGVLKKANAAIASGAALSGSLDAVTGGGMNDLNKSFYYMPGDTFSLSNVQFAGIQTTTDKDFRFFIPLDKPIHPTVSTVSISGKLDVRHSDGTNILFGDDLSNLGTVTVESKPTGIYIRLQKTTGTGSTNNAPLVAYGSSNATITFS